MKSSESCFKPNVLSGKRAFIAGGTSGINLGIARGLAMAGADVAVISRNPEKVQAAVKELSELGCEAWGDAVDVRNYNDVEASIQTAADRLGPLDIVVSGAAGNFVVPANKMSANAFRTVVDIDLNGTFNVFRACFDHLSKGGASLIAISAGQGARPYMFQAHVCAAKAGINMLVQALAMEWGPAGIRVNAISPGPIDDTEGMDRLGGGEEGVKRMKQALAMRRFGRKDEIADMAVFLAGPSATYITGSIFNVDGGCDLGDASMDALNFGEQ